MHPKQQKMGTTKYGKEQLHRREERKEAKPSFPSRKEELEEDPEGHSSSSKVSLIFLTSAICPALTQLYEPLFLTRIKSHIHLSGIIWES